MSGRARRATAAAALILTLAGCGDQEGTPTGAVVSAMRSAFGASEPPRQLTRAEIDALPYATVAVRFDDDGPRAFLVAVAESEGYVTYSAADRRNLILHGAAVTSVRGVGSGLVSHAAGPGPDPLVRRTPVAEWPERIVRTWRISDDLGRETVRAAECRPTAVGIETVEILDQRRDLVRIEERCVTADGTFVNLHWAEAETGFVWRTRQWIGGLVPPIRVEILKPFG